jgi:hypothetical protein
MRKQMLKRMFVTIMYFILLVSTLGFVTAFATSVGDGFNINKIGYVIQRVGVELLNDKIIKIDSDSSEFNPSLELFEYNNLTIFYNNLILGNVVSWDDTLADSTITYGDVFLKATNGLSKKDVTKLNSCAIMTKCVYGYILVDQIADCSWLGQTFCEYGCNNAVCNSPPITCVDSDSLTIDPYADTYDLTSIYINGNVTVSQLGVLKVHADSCSNGIVNEYYCSNFELKNISIKCDIGCLDTHKCEAQASSGLEGTSNLNFINGFISSLSYYTDTKTLEVDTSLAYKQEAILNNYDLTIYMDSLTSNDINFGKILTPFSAIIASNLENYDQRCNQNIRFSIYVNGTQYNTTRALICRLSQNPVIDYPSGKIFDYTYEGLVTTNSDYHLKYFKDGVWTDSTITDPLVLCKSVWGNATDTNWNLEDFAGQPLFLYSNAIRIDGGVARDYMPVNACYTSGILVRLTDFFDADITLEGQINSPNTLAYPSDNVKISVYPNNGFYLDIATNDTCSGSITSNYGSFGNGLISTKSSGKCIGYYVNSANSLAISFNIDILNSSITTLISDNNINLEFAQSENYFTSAFYTFNYVNAESGEGKVDINLVATYNDRNVYPPLAFKSINDTYVLNIKNIYGYYLISVRDIVYLNGEPTNIPLSPSNVIAGAPNGYSFTDAYNILSSDVNIDAIKQYPNLIRGKNTISVLFYIYKDLQMNYYNVNGVSSRFLTEKNIDKNWYGPFRIDREVEYRGLEDYICQNSVITNRTNGQGFYPPYKTCAQDYSLLCVNNILSIKYCDYGCFYGMCYTDPQVYNAMVYPSCDLSSYLTCDLTDSDYSSYPIPITSKGLYPVILSNLYYCNTTGKTYSKTLGFNVKNCGEYDVSLSKLGIVIPDIYTSQNFITANFPSGSTLNPLCNSLELHIPVSRSDFDTVCGKEFNFALYNKNDNKIYFANKEIVNCMTTC